MTNTIHLMDDKIAKPPEVSTVDHVEISVKLAYAIGWLPKHVRVIKGVAHIGASGDRRPFDYRDLNILWKVAEAFDAFPFESANTEEKKWIASSGKTSKTAVCKAETAELATALAVIEAAKTFKLSK